MPQCQCGEPLSAKTLINPIAYFRAALRRVDVFQVGSTHYSFTGFFDNKGMPGTGSKVGQIALNMIGHPLQRVEGGRTRINLGFEPFTVMGFEGQQRFNIGVFQLANVECLHRLASPCLNYLGYEFLPAEYYQSNLDNQYFLDVTDGGCGMAASQR